jgi:hypothetical protein
VDVVFSWVVGWIKESFSFSRGYHRTTHLHHQPYCYYHPWPWKTQPMLPHHRKRKSYSAGHDYLRSHGNSGHDYLLRSHGNSSHDYLRRTEHVDATARDHSTAGDFEYNYLLLSSQLPRRWPLGNGQGARTQDMGHVCRCFLFFLLILVALLWPVCALLPIWRWSRLRRRRQGLQQIGFIARTHAQVQHQTSSVQGVIDLIYYCYRGGWTPWCTFRGSVKWWLLLRHLLVCCVLHANISCHTVHRAGMQFL